MKFLAQALLKPAGLGLVLALSVAPVLAQTVCREPAAPAQTRTEIVAPEMHANGVTMSVRALHAQISADDLIAHFRALWAPLATGKRPGSMEHRVEDWRVISTVEGDCFTTVQIKPEGKGSYALVAVSRKPDGSRPSTAGLEFPMLPGSKVLADYGYVDGVRNARTVVVTNQARLSSNVDYYLSTLQKGGWVVLMQGDPRTADGKTSRALLMKKGLEEISLVFTADSGGQVTVVANRVDRP